MPPGIALAVAVAGKSGEGHPTGQISLLVDGTAPQTVGRDFQTPSTLTLNYGESSVLFSNGPSLAGQSSVLPNLSSGFSAGVHEVQASYPGDSSFDAAQATYSFTVTKEDSIVADFFPLGAAVVNVPVTLAGQLVLANNGCAPYGGTVTITDYTPNPPVVLGSAPASQQYCDSYSIPVTFTSGGTHLLRVSFSGDSNVNASYNTYEFPVATTTYSYVSLSADVSNVVVGSPVTLTAQVGSGANQYTATGTMTFVDGPTTLGTANLDSTGTATLVVSSFTAGTHNIMANYSGDAILQASSGGPMTVMVADFAMQAQPASLTIAAGQSATSALTILPVGGSTETLQLSCGNAPANLTCAFNPATVTLDGTDVASVNITVSAKPPVKASLIARHGTLGLSTSFTLIAVFLSLGGRRSRKRLFYGLLGLVTLILFSPGCGSSSKPAITPNVTYVLNVTATGGPAAKTTPLVVTVTN